MPRKTNKYRTLKTRLKFAEVICEQYENGVTIASACEAAGVSYSTFMNWVITQPEVQEMYDLAKNKIVFINGEKLREKAESALLAALEPKEVTEVHKETYYDEGPAGGSGSSEKKALKTKIKAIKRTVEPHPSNIQFAYKVTHKGYWTTDESSETTKPTDSGVSEKEAQLLIDWLKDADIKMPDR